MGKKVTLMGQENKSALRELKKHAAAIHCSNTLSLLQRKISNALLYHAYQALSFKEEHEITIKQLCRLIGYQGNNHSVIRDALRELLSTVIEWNLIDELSGNENWTASSILASVSLEGPLCYYAYSPRMKQLLHSPSMFGKIDLVIQSKFRSSYGLALYENCIRYRGLPHTKWLDMALFKKLMGVPLSKYSVFRDFKRRVLDKAVDEVNTYSDLIISAEFSKEGRRAVKVRFNLKERAKKSRLGKTRALVAESDGIKTKLKNQYELTTEQIEQLLSEYELSFVQEKMAVIEASTGFMNNKIQNLPAYLFSALKKNYQSPKTTKEEPVLSTGAYDFNYNDLKRDIEAIRQSYSQYREKTIEAAIAGLRASERDNFYGDFRAFAEPVIHTILQLQRHKYSRDTVLDSPQLKALLRRFAIRELASLTITSLEEFVANQAEPVRLAWQQLKSYDPDDPLLRFNE